MFTVVHTRRNMLYVAILFLAIAVVSAALYQIFSATSAFSYDMGVSRTVVIDPGHGGIDPGAVGAAGTLEKDVNLNISLCLKDILLVNGYRVVMTREADVSIHDEGIKSVSKIKTSDLKNRLKIIDKHDAIAVSIHQNKFKDKSSWGAQMFYGKNNPKSELLARSIQDELVSRLEPDNKREIKKSTSAVYIVHNAKNPIVLVECGFLSNRKDEARLSDEEYQQKVAFAIFCGIENAEIYEQY